MKTNSFQGELTDVSAKKEALVGKHKALQTVGVYIYSCDMNSWTSHIQIKEAEVV